MHFFWGLLMSVLFAAGLPSEFKNFKDLPQVQIELRYATDNNFMGRNLYGDFNQAYLHEEAFGKLKKADQILRDTHPKLRLHVFDALRPRSIQRILFARVKGTLQEHYVADPDIGSVHNYGFAVDLTLATVDGHELDMGTGFDNFTDLAQPKYEAKLLKEGKLSEEQVDHRKILRHVMKQAGFTPISNEWWHFDGLPIEKLKASYKIVE
jgi:D-alanyl-D-alanine dipeptidase